MSFVVQRLAKLWWRIWWLLVLATTTTPPPTNGAWISSSPQQARGRSLRILLFAAAADSSSKTTISPRNGVDATSSVKDLIRQTNYLKNPRPKDTTQEAIPETDLVEVSDKQRCLELLKESLESFNSTAASDLITEISKLRQQQKNGEEAAVELLNWLLQQGPDSPTLPIWSKIRPLGRFSRRARWASLKRTLDLATPPAQSEDEGEDTENNRQIRRRRALVTLIRSLAAENPTGMGMSTSTRSQPAIRVLEKQAALEQKNKNSANEDLTKRRPEGLETPKYEIVLKKSNTFEIRRYDEFSVCSVSMNKPRPTDSPRTDATVSEPTMRGASAFGALAGYLFGKNQEKRPMKMTTPVLTTNANRGNDSEKRLMSFVLPSEYWKDERMAPRPLEGSGVTLERFHGGERAVVMFGGYASKKTTDQKTQELLRQLEKDGTWQTVEGESVALAQYNDPFTPPWKRLNEVSIAVIPRTWNE